MLDARLRPLVDPPLKRMAAILVRIGLSANGATLVGLGAAIGAFAFIVQSQMGAALALILLSRLLDGLDGAIAGLTRRTDFGGYLDITADFAFYALIPLGFGLASPANTMAALVLLASFILSGVSFLAYAILAAKRGEISSARGEKSFFYLGGLVEGTETIAFFVLICLMPSWFPALAYGFAALCVLNAIGRTLVARRAFDDPA